MHVNEKYVQFLVLYRAALKKSLNFKIDYVFKVSQDSK